MDQQLRGVTLSEFCAGQRFAGRVRHGAGGHLFCERHVRAADDPYEILGADRAWGDEQLREHWRRLVRENHPDRQIANGLPPEAVAIATSRLAAINAAWEAIRKDRRIS